MSCSISSTETSRGSAAIVATSSWRSACGTPAERQELVATIAALPREVSVLLIEHDMDLVCAYADRISVLVNGALLTEGPAEAVAKDARVRAVYLGEERHG